jgi:anti-sigma-K factor RskA
MMAQNGTRDQDLDLLLPWYVNGTLNSDEQEAVEAYLARSSDARDEVELLRALRQQVKDEQIENSPGELGLQRLKREIKQEQESGDRMAGRTLSVASFWRPLAVAACLVVMIQAGIMIGLPGGGGEVEVAGGQVARTPAVIQVTFAPEATEQEIREVLQSAGASIADGPSALGVYGLRLQGEDDAAIEEALANLRARGDVVTFAERK